MKENIGMGNNPEIMYHRGIRQENKLPNGFEGIVKANPGDLVEFDVFLLSDGEVVVGHSKDLKVEEKEIEDRDISQFEKFDQPTTEGGNVEGRKLPTLREALFLANDIGVKPAIEIKGSTPEKMAKNAEATINLIKEMHPRLTQEFVKNIRFYSFSFDGLKVLKEELEKKNLESKLNLSWTSRPEFAQKDYPDTYDAANKIKKEDDWLIKGIKLAKLHDFDGYNIHWSIVLNRPEIVKIAQDEGLKVSTWKIDATQEDIDKFKKIGVDIISCETQ